MSSASHNAPVKSGGSNEALPFSEQELVVQRWSIMWRTILLSCLGETLFPYCRYLRVLDLRDVYELLDDDKFRGKIQQWVPIAMCSWPNPNLVTETSSLAPLRDSTSRAKPGARTVLLDQATYARRLPRLVMVGHDRTIFFDHVD